MSQEQTDVSTASVYRQLSQPLQDAVDTLTTKRGWKGSFANRDYHAKTWLTEEKSAYKAHQDIVKNHQEWAETQFIDDVSEVLERTRTMTGDSAFILNTTYTGIKPNRGEDESSWTNLVESGTYQLPGSIRQSPHLRRLSGEKNGGSKENQNTWLPKSVHNLVDLVTNPLNESSEEPLAEGKDIVIGDGLAKSEIRKALSNTAPNKPVHKQRTRSALERALEKRENEGRPIQPQGLWRTACKMKRKERRTYHDKVYDEPQVVEPGEIAVNDSSNPYTASTLSVDQRRAIQNELEQKQRRESVIGQLRRETGRLSWARPISDAIQLYDSLLTRLGLRQSAEEAVGLYDAPDGYDVSQERDEISLSDSKTHTVPSPSAYRKAIQQKDEPPSNVTWGGDDNEDSSRDQEMSSTSEPDGLLTPTRRASQAQANFSTSASIVSSQPGYNWKPSDSYDESEHELNGAANVLDQAWLLRLNSSVPTEDIALEDESLRVYDNGDGNETPVSENGHGRETTAKRSDDFRTVRTDIDKAETTTTSNTNGDYMATSHRQTPGMSRTIRHPYIEPKHPLQHVGDKSGVQRMEQVLQSHGLEELDDQQWTPGDAYIAQKDMEDIHGAAKNSVEDKKQRLNLGLGLRMMGRDLDGLRDESMYGDSAVKTDRTIQSYSDDLTQRLEHPRESTQGFSQSPSYQSSRPYVERAHPAQDVSGEQDVDGMRDAFSLFGVDELRGGQWTPGGSYIAGHDLSTLHGAAASSVDNKRRRMDIGLGLRLLGRSLNELGDDSLYGDLALSSERSIASYRDELRSSPRTYSSNLVTP